MSISPRNNGGSTGYYDLPIPSRACIIDTLEQFKAGNIDIFDTLAKIYSMIPSTLNDLIEYKNMQPWQHEVFKACYALDERAAKATDGSSSRLREINKMEYYVGRGKDLELRGRND